MMPKVGSVIKTPDGDAEVVEANAITETVTARIILPDNSAEMKRYTLRDIQGGASETVEEEDIEIDEDIKSLLDE